MAATRWQVYLVRCRDNTLYCGIATDLARRLAQHNAGAGAKYIVPSRRPSTCVWKRRARDQGEALRLEYWLKQRTVADKRRLAEGSAGLRRTPDGGWRIVAKKGI